MALDPPNEVQQGESLVAARRHIRIIAPTTVQD